VALKPTSSISKPQETFDFANNKSTTLEIKGRHDTCIALRVPAVVEAVAAIVLADLLLIYKCY
jgi:chorismate synthase